MRDKLKPQGLNTQLAYQRYVAEQILNGFKAEYPNIFLVGGGLIHDQRDCQTGDVDIRFVRQASVEELQNVFIQIAPMLQNYGIKLEKIHPPVYLDMPNRIPGMKFQIVAKLGNARVDTHIDMSFGDGRKCAFPPSGKWDAKTPVLMEGLPIHVGRVQRIETQVAEKLVAILDRGQSNTRMKDYANIAMVADKLDRDFLASEIARVMEDRYLESPILKDVPDGLDLSLLRSEDKIAEWASFVRKTGRPVDMMEALCAVRQIYAQARPKALSLAVAREQNEMLQLLDQPHAMRLPKPRRAAEKKASTGNIIDLDRYRQTAPRM
ncbi:nucleotidyl transferase AbiEii/AbiGii toxin family protein [Rhizobium ruizarguesonis]|uniref:nucleotidyl transferase AbiEii/AbiGii toxin family protein n=1 Tax=Rhizobium ruizarguesonis TaxID=2081791 RepID=UPI0013EEA459|nr:nucleotidyl transferase AbiEii/AbiGii toxin family protein [Rhizobium ruizarguesonis]